MQTEITILLSFIAVVANAIRWSRALHLQRKIAEEKGISDFHFTLLIIGVSLYAVPQVAYFMFRLRAIFSVWFPFVVMLTHFPGIYLADSIGDTLDRGYDFQRNLAKKIKEVEFAGIISGLILLAMWFGFNLFLVNPFK
jgi:hypothetical protein